MRGFLLLVLTLIGSGGGAARAESALTVFAAASLGGALEEIAADYPDPVIFAFGGSGVMARQVAADAPADLIILASTDWMTWLASQGVRDMQDAVVVAANALVLIAPADTQPPEDIQNLPDALAGGYLAMGHRDAVPAGVYARQWMQHAGLWEALRPYLAETDNVRAALALVARGQAAFGVVYASDVQGDRALKVHYAIPAGAHDPIHYPAAALSPRGAAFLTHLTSPAAQAIFARRGFLQAAP